METKKRPINNPLVSSSIVLSFAACLVALIHVEIELHAHRKMLQVLTQQREESIHSRGTVNDESIAPALCSETGKGECFGFGGSIFRRLRVRAVASQWTFLSKL